MWGHNKRGGGGTKFYPAITCNRKNTLKIFFTNQLERKTIFVTYSGTEDFLNDSKKKSNVIIYGFYFHGCKHCDILLIFKIFRTAMLNM